jgi:predicted murein hydrolase (TIGR00659 family)
MNERVLQFWVYLQAGPLFWLTLTLLAYLLAETLFRLSGRNPLVHPVALAVAGLAAVLLATGVDYATFFDGAQFIHFLLGPTTVALAVPLFRHRQDVRARLVPIAVALIIGSITGIATSVGLALLLGGDARMIATIAPKSVSSPIAMGVAEKLGGLPSLTAAVVIVTGIVGAMTATPLLNVLRIRDPRVRGFAVGMAAHGIGTARAFQVNPLAGTFAGIAMALNALMTALLTPVLLAWLH